MGDRKGYGETVKENNRENSIRMILKFDTGADGFLKMIHVLAISAVVVLLWGIYFLLFVYHDISAAVR